MNELITTHALDFELRPWHRDPRLVDFRVGTCKGLYGMDEAAYCIIAIKNEEKGNGHLDDMFEWFAYACKRDSKSLIVDEILNRKFYKHLIKKRGFTKYGKNRVIKRFR